LSQFFLASAWREQEAHLKLLLQCWWSLRREGIGFTFAGVDNRQGGKARVWATGAHLWRRLGECSTLLQCTKVLIKCYELAFHLLVFTMHS